MKEKDFGDIYCITNITNNKQYIGQCVKFYSNGRKNGYKNRYKRHIREALNETSNCVVLSKAIKKYGLNNFKIYPILSCLKTDLNYYENYYIIKYNTLSPHGYNLITGKSNYEISEYTRNKLKSITLTKERKIQIREHFLGKCFRKRKNDLPMYIYLIKNKGYEVRHNELKIRKVYTSKKLNMDIKLKKAKEYLQSILKE